MIELAYPPMNCLSIALDSSANATAEAARRNPQDMVSSVVVMRIDGYANPKSDIQAEIIRHALTRTPTDCTSYSKSESIDLGRTVLRSDRSGGRNTAMVKHSATQDIHWPVRLSLL